jgi:hypothetical protein
LKTRFTHDSGLNFIIAENEEISSPPPSPLLIDDWQLLIEYTNFAKTGQP